MINQTKNKINKCDYKKEINDIQGSIWRQNIGTPETSKHTDINQQKQNNEG